MEGFHPPRLFRRAGGEGKAARPRLLPLVLGEPQEGRSGTAAPALGLSRRVSQGAADPVRQARVRLQQPEALQGSGATADRQDRDLLGRPAFGGSVRKLYAADATASIDI